ncbi:MAG TPA: lipase maturation factor family protein [Kofleriaceae bacterium]|nr:lipase maturation factor family protein [Kofleriaceae bacterium]
MAEPDRDADVIDVRPPLERWLSRLAPRRYTLTRWLILRLLGVVYLFAFLGLLVQGPPLLGEHGLTPVGTYFDRLRDAGLGFWDVPSVLWWSSSDGAMQAWAIVGLVLSLALVIGYANMPTMFLLWAIYGSFVRVGQLWFSFGWEIQILETTLIAMFLVHAWDPRPLRSPPPPTTAIVLMRWLVFRIMLGAGLIKLRGSGCWTDLTCLDAHFETQPIPNPLSPLFDGLPHVVLASGVVYNHIVEVVLPWFVFGPRAVRLVAGILMAAFQVVLIASGNLAFLNWLTLVPILALLDDDFLLRLLPRRARAWLRARIPETPPRDGKQLGIAMFVAFIVFLLWMPVLRSFDAPIHVVLAIAAAGGFVAAAIALREYLVRPGRRLDGHQLAVGCFAALVIVKSYAVVDNLTAKRQIMNGSFDRLSIVNTYGAFGSVTMDRHELVIEGTRDLDPDEATWHAYELPCKPGDLARRPCILGPYHRRLDWLIWFSAMDDEPRDPWILHLAWKLLDGDRSIRELIAVDPFDGERPTWIRIRRFVYHLQPYSADTWWTRDHEQLWLPPIALDTPGLREELAQHGWPSPSLH